jgi:putative ABC transport system ATP-binding protein
MKQNTTNGNALIDLKGVVKQYHSLAGDVVALKGIDLRVKAGEFFVVTGKSGAGKTTLINMITGLDHCTDGEIRVDDVPVHELSAAKAAAWRGQHIGVVFQTFELLPTLTILHNVMLPMDFAGKYSPRERKQRALQLLDQVEIAGHAGKLPSEVSGGQQQRVAIARAMANDPQLLVADEPTGSLDSGTAGAVLDVFEKLVASGKTVLLVTHDEDVAERGSRRITLADGEIVAEAEG